MILAHACHAPTAPRAHEVLAQVTHTAFRGGEASDTLCLTCLHDGANADLVCARNPHLICAPVPFERSLDLGERCQLNTTTYGTNSCKSYVNCLKWSFREFVYLLLSLPYTRAIRTVVGLR